MAETLGDRIRRAREEKGWTQAELGRRLGVSNVTVGRWETGLRVPRMRYLRILANQLDKPEGWFLEVFPEGVPPDRIPPDDSDPPPLRREPRDANFRSLSPEDAAKLIQDAARLVQDLMEIVKSQGEVQKLQAEAQKIQAQANLEGNVAQRLAQENVQAALQRTNVSLAPGRGGADAASGEE
jgi:transcriptional regulator with XRE-family HTH domain